MNTNFLEVGSLKDTEWQLYRPGQTIRYSFLESFPYSDYQTYSFEFRAKYFSNINQNFNPFTADQRVAVRKIFDWIEQITSIKFSEGVGNPLTDPPEIRFANSVQTDSGGVNARRVPGEIGVNRLINDIFIAQGNTGTAIGGYGFKSLIHEISHALGLKHPFDDPGQKNSVNRALSVMAYKDNQLSGNAFAFAGEQQGATPLLYDVSMLMFLYPPTNSIGSGNSVYQFVTDTDDSLSTGLQQYKTFFGQRKTIVDSDGIDTIDARSFGSSFNLQISLNSGSLSSIGGVDNIAIAYGSKIENAKGGSGNDELIGNSAINRLEGNNGDDRLDGGVIVDAQGKAISGDGQADVLVGGADNDNYIVYADGVKDTIIDSEGSNWIYEKNAVTGEIHALRNLLVYKEAGESSWFLPDRKVEITRNSPLTITDTRSGSTVTVQLGDADNAFTEGDFGIRLKERNAAPVAPTTTGTVSGGELFDSDPITEGTQPVDDETGLGNYRVVANTLNADVANILNGSTGSDTIRSGAGHDTINAGQSTGTTVTGDIIEAGTGNDTVYAGHGADKIDLGDGNDYVGAGDGNNWILAGSGRDTVYTGKDKDWIEGAIEGDLLFSGAGNDTVYADTSNSQSLTLQQAVTNGNNPGSSTQGDLISLGDGDDIGIGSDASDHIFGGRGEDLVIAGAGDDTVFTDFDASSGQFDWQLTRNRSVANGIATISITSGLVEAQAVEGSADAVYAGAGQDWLFLGGGDDYADAGSGDDLVFAEGGNDVVLLGAGDDIVGAAGTDFIDGGVDSNPAPTEDLPKLLSSECHFRLWRIRPPLKNKDAIADRAKRRVNMRAAGLQVHRMACTNDLKKISI